MGLRESGGVFFLMRAKASTIGGALGVEALRLLCHGVCM